MNHTADHGIRFGRIAAIAPRKGHREGPRLLHEGIWLYEDIREQQSRRLQQRTGIVDHHMGNVEGSRPVVRLQRQMQLRLVPLQDQVRAIG
jgi:hypothetical protein